LEPLDTLVGQETLVLLDTRDQLGQQVQLVQVDQKGQWAWLVSLGLLDNQVQ
jgi:hypothetical protein